MRKLLHVDRFERPREPVPPAAIDPKLHVFQEIVGPLRPSAQCPVRQKETEGKGKRTDVQNAMSLLRLSFAHSSASGYRLRSHVPVRSECAQASSGDGTLRNGSSMKYDEIQCAAASHAYALLVVNTEPLTAKSRFWMFFVGTSARYMDAACCTNAGRAAGGSASDAYSQSLAEFERGSGGWRLMPRSFCVASVGIATSAGQKAAVTIFRTVKERSP